MPFLELVAVATHTIAVNLYKLDLGLHKHAAQPSGENSKKNDQLGRWSLPFCVRFYARKEYPDGPADAAGYWAENRIFGGVVLFGRGDDGTGVCFCSHTPAPLALLLHSKVAVFICRVDSKRERHIY